MNNIAAASSYDRRGLRFASTDLVKRASYRSPHSISIWETASTLSDRYVWTTEEIVCEKPPHPFLSRYPLQRVESGDRKVQFDSGLSLTLDVAWEDDRFIVSDQKFGIYGFGRTLGAAVADYSDFFVEFFADIAETPNSELPPSTRKFKRTLLTFGKLVNSV